MHWIKGWKENEKGSLTIEFLGMLPLMLLMVIILWQFMISAYGVIVTQSAANDAAKAFSLSARESEARTAARDTLQAGSNLKYRSVSVNNYSGSQEFQVTVHADLELVFIPKKWVRNTPSVNISRTVSGRVLD
ncbi:TadE/TadG family type IV pilus assembly protein [Sutcliffiella rhizosphaerae]|uniref:TadE-like domain-containing protein n=1 Tax=Sutcliffiella rhizosphaerae TaxID=2880967 RepID=A0ABN8A8X8_9BACI|nr:TadE/TadG family type IV pilus assembly protein [Sutcliffiella rhizosphaerae]CAG9620271.1 hypothetical protein BACCIP111883_01039 [Sutcliffiella rhizosphaerae]